MKVTLFSPTGARIIGTSETVPGCALVQEVRLMDDGSLDVEYEGETEVFWDGQMNDRRDGERVWQDDNGKTWRESELFRVTDEALLKRIETIEDYRGRVGDSRDQAYARIAEILRAEADKNVT